jgi:hypothetical protein
VKQSHTVRGFEFEANLERELEGGAPLNVLSEGVLLPLGEALRERGGAPHNGANRYADWQRSVTDAVETAKAEDHRTSRLADTGLLFIGENHSNQEFHAVQLHTIKALHEAGREVLIGLEM